MGFLKDPYLGSSKGKTNLYIINYTFKCNILFQCRVCKVLECRYCSCIRSVLVYAVPVFYYSLPMYLKTELERVQKRALAIIFPGMDYSNALADTGIPSVERYNENTCKRTLNSILNDKGDRLRNLLPSAHKSAYSLRRCRCFETPRWKTNRFRDTFLMKSCIEHDII